MRLSRYLCGGSLALLACSSPTITPMPTTAGSESEGESSTVSSAESGSESETDTGDPVQSCTSEWDCGVGERCVEGSCACVGCACSRAGAAPPDTVEAEEEPSIPIEIGVPGCSEDSDCPPLEYCSGGACVETTACVDDLDCRDEWPESDRFCVDDLCQHLDCDDDLDCPDGALCDDGCRWLELVADCVDVPSFDEVLAHTLTTPDVGAVVVLDLDADGHDDLAILEDGALAWVMSTGVGFDPPTPWVAEPGAEIVAIGRADIHGDGIDELLVSHAGAIGVEFLLVGPDGPQHGGFVETMAVPEAATTMDVDFDGLPDLVSGTAVVGPETLVQAQLGDGSGTFETLWADTVTPFELDQPFALHDQPSVCERALVSLEPDFFGARRLDHEGVRSPLVIIDRLITAHANFVETVPRPAGHVATAPLVGRGVLFLVQEDEREHIEVAPEPAAVALLSQDGASVHHVIIDRGVEAAQFVEVAGDPLVAGCRGSLGFALGAIELDVGDFDGDARDDLLGRGADGSLRVWYSRG
jgi:hypothetical protein